MWKDASTLYYFFSTSAQAIAAVSGLFGTFLIFRFQYLKTSIGNKEEHIALAFSRHAAPPFLAYFYSMAEQDDYEDFVTHEQRVDWVKKKFSQFWVNGEDRYLKECYQSNNRNTNNSLASLDDGLKKLKGWHLEIQHLDHLRLMRQKIRQSAIGLTCAGLAIVAMAMGLILFVETFYVDGSYNDRASCSIFSFSLLVLIYLGCVIWGTVSAFRD